MILANYNHGHYIEDNLKGLRAQNYPYWELIVVDDASTDNSRDIIAKYAAEDSRIKPFYQSTNLGVLATFNYGLAKATGDLFYGSAADDFISNHHFFDQVINQLLKYPQASGVVLKTRIIDSVSSKHLWDMGNCELGYVSPDKIIEGFFGGSLFLPGSSAIWRMNLINKIGFQYDLGPQADYFINHALPMISGVCFVNEIGVVMRKSKETYSASTSNEEFFFRHALVESRLRKICANKIIPDELIERWRFNLINGRLAITRQEQFISTIREFYQQIRIEEDGSLPNRFTSCRKYLMDQIDNLETELNEQRTMAQFIFKKNAPIVASDFKTMV